MRLRRLAPILASFAFGLLSALQSRINGELSVFLGNGIEAALVSFSVGLVLLLGICLVRPSVRAGVARIPAALRERRLAWWQLLGGIIGGLFVGAQSATVPLVGVAIFTVAVVAGQSASSLFVDRIGLGPAGKQPITVRRVLSALLAFTAVVIAVSHRLESPTFSILAVAVAFIVGAGTSVQQAFNGRVTRASGSPMSATLVNFILGTAILTLIFAGRWTLAGAEPHGLAGGPWWAYLGGAVGVIFIALAAWVVPIIGVLVFAVVSIAGQLSGAVILDLVMPTAGTDLGWNLVLGVVLAFVAVGVAAANQRPSAQR
jgi:transporter family-2 protein